MLMSLRTIALFPIWKTGQEAGNMVTVRLSRRQNWSQVNNPAVLQNHRSGDANVASNNCSVSDSGPNFGIAGSRGGPRKQEAVYARPCGGLAEFNDRTGGPSKPKINH